MITSSVSTIQIHAVIPAKGTSKRLPDKNIYPVRGKPMLYWAIQACFEALMPILPVVSSEDARILTLAESYGAKAHRRDPHLADDDCPKHNVIVEYLHCLEERHDPMPDLVISLQPNSPEVRGSDLDRGIDKMILNEELQEVFSVDPDLNQNAAFRIMRPDYVFKQAAVSTYCGVVICDAINVHTEDDIKKLRLPEYEHGNHC